jgi:hypothetical protein
MVAVAAGDDGDVYVAWSGFFHYADGKPTGKEGVWAVAGRRGGFGRARRLTPRDGVNRGDVALEADRRGHAAVAWVDNTGAAGSRVRLALAGRSGRFAHATAVPMPGAGTSVVWTNRPVLEYAADGRILVAWSASKSTSENPETMVAIRERDGHWNAVQTLPAPISVADAASGPRELLVVCTEGNTSANHVAVFAAAGGERVLRRIADLTPPGLNMFGGGPSIVANERGDALVAFPGNLRPDFPFPDRVYASLRRRGGTFATAQPVIGPGSLGALSLPSVALARDGAALVTATGGAVQVAYAPKGGSFSPSEAGPAAPDPNRIVSAAFARDGTAHLVQAGFAFRRPRAGPVSPSRRVLGKRADVNTIAIGAHGGITAWTTRTGGGTRVVARAVAAG